MKRLVLATALAGALLSCKPMEIPLDIPPPYAAPERLPVTNADPTAQGPAAAGDAHDWNSAEIEWMTLGRGLDKAAREHKMVCLVIYTTWCPHCASYARVFRDPHVVARARDFVMVKADKDRYPEISARYAPDGEYIPRTYFLTPDNKIADVSAQPERFRFFYSESDPRYLLDGMGRALALLQQ